MGTSNQASYKQYLCGCLFSINIKRTYIDHSIINCSYSHWKETIPKHSNVTVTTNLFSNVYAISMTCFNECFLFYVITGRHQKFIVTLRAFQTAALLRSLKKVIRKRSLFYVISTIIVQCYYQSSKIKFILVKFPYLILFLDYGLWLLHTFLYRWFFN